MESNNKKQRYDSETSETPASKASYKKTEDKISFNSWFTFKVNERRKVQAHHYETIKAFFTKRGLSEQEATEKYDSALKAFGY